MRSESGDDSGYSAFWSWLNEFISRYPDTPEGSFVQISSLIKRPWALVLLAAAVVIGECSYVQAKSVAFCDGIDVGDELSVVRARATEAGMVMKTKADKQWYLRKPALFAMRLYSCEVVHEHGKVTARQFDTIH